MTVPEFVEHLKQQAMEQHARMQHQGHQHGPGGHSHSHGPGGQGNAQPITPGPPNPRGLAVAKFLRNQDLKPRTVILNGERKDMFKGIVQPLLAAQAEENQNLDRTTNPANIVKRAFRALQSPAYEKARKKNPLLPEITDRAALENCLKLLPMSMLALRVAKMDPHEGHDHGPKKGKRVKGQWTVRIVQEQEAKEDCC